jgi:hypothetical protein
VRRARLLLAILIAIPIAILVYLLFPSELNIFGSQTNTIFAAVVYVVAENIFDRILGGSAPSAKEIAVETHRLEQQSKSKERLYQRKRVHQQKLVESFFEPLSRLEIYRGATPFSLGICAEGKMLIYAASSKVTIPQSDEALSHLKAPEYRTLSETFDKLKSPLAEYNLFAKQEITRIDLLGKLSRKFPKFEVVCYFPRSGFGSWYNVDTIWSIVEQLAAGLKFDVAFTRWGDDLAGFQERAADVLMMFPSKSTPYGTGGEIGGSKDKKELNALEDLIRKEAESFEPLLSKRAAFVADSSSLQRDVRNGVKAVIDDCQVQKWLYGRCKVEDSLEEEESRHLVEIESR